ncbi:50S ribosome-binding GTPase [Isoptericola sp. CG 20/1183]|uniref:50S ribosome-binding GTPase n=1 Tax=Isoptericola halotolerans TaxID=300560 RepID=A0ABX5EHA6_9MICO|nr:MULTISPECIES: GTPase [Isoptericola]PRZ07584.1 50S ribosome-binding GTPase [Isoptericola halotolerans]PRZ08056.1 50S ribosome-binding GTPase [Isoptericola sp. CG 20/1183]
MKPDLATRTAALAQAVAAGAGRLDRELADEARGVVERARERGGLSAEHTVAALAGATGSGKSSVLNAVAGTELAEPGVQRPTTSHALAAVWGEGADDLLDWLDVRRRHEMEPDVDATPSNRSAGLLRRARPPAGISTGLVLLDLPDHDSVVVEHRVRAERLVERADLLVWVVDPQKYADAALHERYLRPLAGRSEVVVVALNQIDRLAPDEAEAILADLRRLVAADGLSGARVLGVSARTGEGVDRLRGLLADAARRREAATARLAADTRAVARRVVDACGQAPPARAADRAQGALVDALEEAAGATTVVDAVRRAAKRDAHLATGWPVTRWITRARKDPLRRLGLRSDQVRVPVDRPDLARTSLPQTRPSVRASAATAVRTYVDQVSAGAPDAWVLAARERGTEAVDRLPDTLDQAVASTRLEEARRPVWWRAVGVLQWLLLAAAVVGLLWLGVAAALRYFQLPALIMPVLTFDFTRWGGGAFDLPWATVLALGGILGGLLVALLARPLAALGARRRAGRVRRRLRTSVEAVAREDVREPVAAEMAALATCREHAATAAA